jgi:putative phosphoribosyl transferase
MHSIPEIALQKQRFTEFVAQPSLLPKLLCANPASTPKVLGSATRSRLVPDYPQTLVTPSTQLDDEEQDRPMSSTPPPPAPRMFTDRHDAGRMLAGMLTSYRDRDDVVVLGLPRGGLPVSWEIATALHAPIDVLVVRKLGVPGHEEYAMGAIASGGQRVVDHETVRQLRITPHQLAKVTQREHRELSRREIAYRTGAPSVDIAGKVVILADDGIATGATMRTAVLTVRARAAARIVVAVPVAPRTAFHQFRSIADNFVVVASPARFISVGDAYENFHQITDAQVRALLSTPTAR